VALALSARPHYLMTLKACSNSISEEENLCQRVARGPLRFCPNCRTWRDSGGRLDPDAELEIEERAAILEFEGGHPREMAETLAAWQ